MSRKNYFTYFLDLFDTEITEFDGVNKKHPPVKRIMSGIHEYFPLFRNVFLQYNNWLEMNHQEALTYPEIDFCITNSAKVQTKSKIHFRILLDTQDHFISNKSAFYDMFREQEFICPYIKSSETENSHIFKPEDYVISKPDKGCMGMGIEILKYKNITHKENFTISQLFIPKLYKNKIVSNRLYFLVVRTGNVLKSYLYNEFVNYSCIRPLTGCLEKDLQNFNYHFITNYTPCEYNEEEFFNTRHVSHEKFKSIFSDQEFEIILSKIREYLSVITDKISQHITCANEWIPNSTSFHIYGIDALIDEQCNVKFLEINGAPGIISRVYEKSECLDYHILTTELLKILLPDIFKTLSSINKFVFVSEKAIKVKQKKLYIAKSVVGEYPFILEGFMNKKRQYAYKRIKNPFSPDIDVFYGLRDLYVNKFTSDRYYNEIVDFNNSECSRKSRIINKIQGITYYLANKQRLYFKLKFSGLDLSYHPKSIFLTLDDKFKTFKHNIHILEEFLTDKTIIIKPGNGSQGKGIIITQSKNPYEILEEMDKIKNELSYDSFLISDYIDNPYLYKVRDDRIGRKFNIRFYVLVFMDSSENIQVFILQEQVVYFCILEYSKYVNFPKVEQKDNDKMKSLTNLQLIANMNTKYQLNLKIQNYTSSLKSLDLEHSQIQKQFKKICRDTISATKSEFRCVNRFVKDNAAFNLLAYDMLLDENGKLYLIEVNRGADLKAFHSVLGDKMSTDIFEEIFDICVDHKNCDFEYFKKLKIE